MYRGGGGDGEGGDDGDWDASNRGGGDDDDDDVMDDIEGGGRGLLLLLSSSLLLLLGCDGREGACCKNGKTSGNSTRMRRTEKSDMNSLDTSHSHGVFVAKASANDDVDIIML